jgi:hypothetical protein
MTEGKNKARIRRALRSLTYVRDDRIRLDDS